MHPSSTVVVRCEPIHMVQFCLLISNMFLHSQTLPETLQAGSEPVLSEEKNLQIGRVSSPN